MKKLGDICKFQNGYAFQSDKFDNIGIPIIRVSGINGNFVDLSNSMRYIGEVPSAFEVHKGDLLIAMSGATTGKIGEYKNDSIAYINQRVCNFLIE